MINRSTVVAAAAVVAAVGNPLWMRASCVVCSNLCTDYGVAVVVVAAVASASTLLQEYKMLLLLLIRSTVVGGVG